MINYFISDLHLGHKNILEFTTRKGKFQNLEEMAALILSNIKKTVKDTDRLVLLGDICWNRKSFGYLKEFPKNTILVGGNHDVSSGHYQAYRDAGWKIVGCMQHEDAILTHIPVHTSQVEHRFKYNIHGHTHDGHVMITESHGNLTTVRKDPRYLNVSCEVLDFVPMAYEEVKRRYGVA